MSDSVVFVTEWMQFKSSTVAKYTFKGGMELDISVESGDGTFIEVDENLNEVSALEGIPGSAHAVFAHWKLKYDGLFEMRITGVYRHVLDDENTESNVIEKVIQHVIDNVSMVNEKIGTLLDWKTGLAE